MMQNKPNPNYEYDFINLKKKNQKNIDIEIKIKEIVNWKQSSEREDMVDKSTGFGKKSLM